MDPTKQRGFLNNNPGNMDRAAGEPWQGEIRDTVDARLTEFQRGELNHGRFAVFTSAEWGIRAMAKNLFAYHDRLGLNTVQDLIYKWAPPFENNSAAYAKSVADHLGVGVTDRVDVRDYKTLAAVVDAIIRVENGGMPYTGKEIEDGLRLAGVMKPVKVTTSATMQGAATAAAATAGQPIVAAVQDPLQQLAQSLEPMVGMHKYVDYTLLAVKLLLAAVAVYGVWMMVREHKGRAERDANLGDVTAEVGK